MKGAAGYPVKGAVTPAVRRAAGPGPKLGAGLAVKGAVTPAVRRAAGYLELPCGAGWWGLP